MQNVHFKVSANNIIRRFVFTVDNNNIITLAAVKANIASIFGVNNLYGWSIKYQDEENHLVTITSDEELLFAVQIHGNRVLHLLITFGAADNSGNSSWHGYTRTDDMPVDSSANFSGVNNSSLNFSGGNNSSVELATGFGVKNTDRKMESKIDKKKAKIIKKLEKIQKKLSKLDKSKKQSKIAKLEQRLAACTSELAGMGPVNNSGVAPEFHGALVVVDSAQKPGPSHVSKQLVVAAKSHYHNLKKDRHHDKNHAKSLGKTLKALHVISKHGISAGISLDSDKLAKTQLSLRIANDQVAAKKRVVQQQKEILSIMKSQLKKNKKDSKKREKKERKDKKKSEKKERKDKAISVVKGVFAEFERSWLGVQLFN